MTRLPSVGGDNGEWGKILNEFLGVEHNPDGSLKRSADIANAKAKADSAVQLINGKHPDSSGVISLVAADLGSEPLGLSDTTKAAIDARASQAAGITLWKPSTAYTIGQRVIWPDGSLKVVKTNHTSGTTPGTINWSDPPNLASEIASRETDTRRYRHAIEREYQAVVGRVPLPDAFGWDPGVQILTDGRTYWSPYDVETRANSGGNTFYISTVGSGAAPGIQIGTLSSALDAGTKPSALVLASGAAAAVSGGLNLAIVNDTDVAYVTLSAAVSAGTANLSISAPSNALTIDFPAGSRVIAPRQSLVTTIGGSYAAGGDTVVLLDRFNSRAQSMQNSTISQSVNIVGLHPDSILTCSDTNLVWTHVPGTISTYQTPRTNVRNVVDIDASQDGMEYERIGTSGADCDTVPGSWYQAADGTGNLFVNTLSGIAPDNTKQLALLTAEIGLIDSAANNMTVFLKNLRLIGGNSGVQPRASGAGVLTFIAKDCDFLWGGYASIGAIGTSLRNGLNVLGNVVSYCQRVTVAHGCLDGFNYHAISSYIPRAVEIECHGYACGVDSIPTNLAVAPIQNASTVHDGIHIVRINGKYHDTFGAPVADVQTGTKSLTYGSDVWGSRCSADSGYNSGFSAQQAGVEMWVIGCRVWGTSSDIYVNTGATMHLSGTEFDTKSGDGAFDVTIS
jgi:hypothetical protein